MSRIVALIRSIKPDTIYNSNNSIWTEVLEKIKSIDNNVGNSINNSDITEWLRTLNNIEVKSRTESNNTVDREHTK